MRAIFQLARKSDRWGSIIPSQRNIFRNIHDRANDQNVLHQQGNEIEIKIPWGHLAGKWWGTKSVRPMLGLHGWLDNAGTFDTLAPLLPSHVGLLALDWPGHGFSSRLPDGFAYYYTDNIYLLRLLMKKYGWEKLSIFAHSLSNSVALKFAAMYPDKIDMLIGIDILGPLYRPPDNTYKRLVSHMEDFLIADNRNRSGEEPPSYSHDECIERLYIASGKSIDRDKCFHMLNRNIRKSEKFPNKFYFSRDNRLKSFFATIPKELYTQIASKINCPYLYIKTKKTPYLEDEANFHRILDTMRNSNPNFQYVEIDGKHHVHLNEPEKVAEVVNDFIKKYRPLENMTN